MQCHVYHSSKTEGLYVYMAEQDRLDLLPAPLRAQLGEPTLALSFDLHPDRSLDSEDPQVVLDNLESRGFHVQTPPKIHKLLGKKAE